MTAPVAIVALKEMLRQKPSFNKIYQSYLEKHRKFDDNKLADWLPLFDKVVDSLEKDNIKFQLHSSFSKRLMYDISLLYNLIKCNLPFFYIPWWHKITDHIYLGALPFVQHISRFKKIKINSVLSVVENFEREKSFVATPADSKFWKRHGIKNIHISHPDFIPVSLEVLYKAACVLQEEVTASHKVYVHCKAGRGRSASAILSYLMTFKGWTFDKAFRLIKSKRPHIAVKNKRLKIEILACLYEIIELKKVKTLKKLSLLLSSAS